MLRASLAEGCRYGSRLAKEGSIGVLDEIRKEYCDVLRSIDSRKFPGNRPHRIARHASAADERG